MGSDAQRGTDIHVPGPVDGDFSRRGHCLGCSGFQPVRRWPAAVLGFNLLGDGLRDTLDPKMVRVR